LENYKSSINQLEEENKSLLTSLEDAQTEIEDLKTKTNDAESQQRGSTRIKSDQIKNSKKNSRTAYQTRMP